MTGGLANDGQLCSATAASKVDRFFSFSSPYTPVCQAYGLKTWIADVRLILNEVLKLCQLCRYQSFSDQHHYSPQAILSFLTRRHLSFFSHDRSTTSNLSRLSRLLPESSTHVGKTQSM